MAVNSAVHKEGLGQGKLNPGGLGCRAEREQQTKRKSRQCFVPPAPRPGQGSSQKETRQHFSLLSLAFARVSCCAFSIPFSF